MAPGPGKEMHKGRLEGKAVILWQHVNQNAISVVKACQYSISRSRLSSACDPRVLSRSSVSVSKLRWCLRTRSCASRGRSNSLRTVWVIGGSRLTKLEPVEWFVLVVNRGSDSCARYSQLAPLDERCDAEGVDDGTGIECLAFTFFSALICLDDTSIMHVSTELRLLPSIFLFLVHT